MEPSLLRQGDSGPAVTDVRERLRRLGYLQAHRFESSAADEFDGAVADAVRAFQQERGIPVDGVIGPQTFRHLEDARWSLGDRVLVFSPAHLMTGDDIRELQERLVRMGFDCGRPDGVFGTNTDTAIREFQRNVGIAADGTCGPDTFRALAQLMRTVGDESVSVPMRERITLHAVRSGVAGKVVVLDPGGADADERFAQQEASILADVCSRIEGRLAALGTQVLLTRPPTPELVTETTRASFANDTAADLLVSLHVERVVLPGAHGVATFYFGNPQGGSHSLSGQQAAELIQEEICSRTDLVDCRSHPRTWDLLRMTRMPAVWVELGYLSHPGDAARLSDARFRDVLAEAIGSAVVRFFTPMDEATAADR